MEKELFDTTKPMTDGVRIQMARAMRNKNQTELGNLIGVSKQLISRLEKKEKVDDKKMAEIAEALGFTLEGLRSLSRESIMQISYNFYDNSAQNATFGSHCTQTVNHNYGYDPKLAAEHASIYEKVLQKNAEKAGKAKNTSK
ncbi:helix-turn-helix transcriptional regulator [Chitinophaga varians]|uniref:Helix-turn-helix transcriptional regulator n=1 Tax=Chitinophaga varians TaxID=2202339 RepID=A0A847RJW5_9BACT|nr:helix-turn-helix transcriptional regulator [Chitinophaga varians]NLR67309.1 helix-turn-helix transcriptional regulator [Chitinophaga varians]